MPDHAKYSTFVASPDDPSNYRADGTPKGTGFLGAMERPDKSVSSEISIGVNIGGKEVEIPTLVPTLSEAERQWLLTSDISDPAKLPRSIVQKAVNYARQRMAKGQSPFAQTGEGGPSALQSEPAGPHEGIWLGADRSVYFAQPPMAASHPALSPFADLLMLEQMKARK